MVHETKQKLANGLLDEVDLNLEDVDLYSDISAAASSHIKVLLSFKLIQCSSKKFFKQLNLISVVNV